MATLTGVTKHFPKPKEGFITTLSSTISAGAATVPLTSVSGLTNGDVFVGLVEPGLPNEQCFTGTVDTAGTQITSVVWTKGTNVGHNAGVTVVDYVTSTTVGMISKGVLVEHRQDGTHDIAQIVDDNGLEKLKFTETASAVNEFTIANAATGNAPTLSATGSDTNIDVNIAPKGTGEVTKAGNPIDWWEELGRTTLSVAGDTITVSSLPVRKYLMILADVAATGGTIAASIRFNNDSGNNYADRYSNDGAADTTTISQSAIDFRAGTAAYVTHASVGEVVNVASRRKMLTHRHAGATTGAGAVPNRLEGVGLWDNATDAITRVDLVNAGTGDFAIGSEVVVLGHN